jgi:hypothetical protein
MKSLIVIKPNDSNWKPSDTAPHKFKNYNGVYVYCDEYQISKYGYVFQSERRTVIIQGVYVLKDLSYKQNPEKFKQDILSIPIDQMTTLFTNGAYCVTVIENDTVVVFDDFIGYCPVYYAKQKDYVIYATNLKDLKKYDSYEVDEDVLSEFVLTGYTFTFRTYLKGVYCLTPASTLIIKNNDIHVKYHDRFSDQKEIMKKTEEIADEINEELVKAVNRVYDEGIKYSLSLSGGMDSRLIYLLWPDKMHLLTETSGEGTSDYIKAHALVERLGDPSLHALEEHFRDKFADGIDQFYHLCDNPLKVLTDFNYHHLEWKMSRGSQIHLSGVGADLIGGEILHTSRSPKAVLGEALFHVGTDPIRNEDKARMLAFVLGAGTKTVNNDLMSFRIKQKAEDYTQEIVNKMDYYLGETRYNQTYKERFQVYKYSTVFFSTGILPLEKYINLMPFFDSDLTKAVVKYHPYTREHKRLTIAILKKYREVADIPLDTTHLKIDAPFHAHKFFRILRLVMNIGYQKKIPLLQQGGAPKYRVYPYFDPENKDFKQLVRHQLENCRFLDKAKVQTYLSKIESVDHYNFYVAHNEEANIKTLLRLSYLDS